MNDPHVVRLTYRLKTNPVQFVFKNPPALLREYDGFRIQMEGGILTVEMKEHHASVQSAKEKAEVFIRAWEVHSAFDFDWDFLRFEYEDAEIIDRNPSPRVPGQSTVNINCTLPMDIGECAATVHPYQLTEYPAPPTRFKVSPDVETMWFRYQQHLQDKETYQSMGYFCLSMMQWSIGIKKGARDEVSRQYKVDRDVLDKLSELTSVKGTPMDARKLGSGSTLVPLTDSERRWIRETVKTLIRRKGEYDFDPSTASLLRQIRMADLPQL